MGRLRNSYDVIIAGGGPAGASAAIHLANHSVRVLLIEQKHFPRHKVCGEFISPECVRHFQKLGVLEEMWAAEPSLVNQTIFYSHTGHSVAIPSSWFGAGAALGLSRAVMDNNLLRRAQRLGVSVQEDSTVTELMEERGVVRGVRLKSGGVEREHLAAITIDATGRARALARKVRCSVGAGSSRSKPKLVALKAHLEKTRAAPGVCEIYSYPGGYGGLSTVENDLSNLCFIVAAADVRRCHSNPEAVLRETVMSNPRAAYTLDAATVCSEWLSVSLESFGRQQPSPAPGLLAIGDSAAFIDPFTGSGMLMALESGELAAAVIVRHLEKPGETPALAALAAEYAQEYRRKFRGRLIMCGLLRRVAFKPRFAELTIAACGASERLRNSIAKATRSNNTTEGPRWQESAK